VKAARRQSGFTLIEMLVVIAILGLLAGLAVPALKNLGKSNANVSAARQLLDDVGRARQLAMANRTTVYMVFVPTNFWDNFGSGTLNGNWLNSLAPTIQTAATNLCDRQLSGYTFIANGAIGDQPGRHQWHYLASWQSLPDGTFIAQQKFNTAANSFYTVPTPIIPSSPSYQVYGFNFTNTIPFPTETNTVSLPYLPYIAFNYLGQLTFDGQNLANRDEYIPLAHGTVAAAIDPATKTFQMRGSPQVSETPAGNSSNISYNLVHIDALTGRAVLEYYKIQ
jgi:prepilin-type N-terminal cleavage/methylation domain-containing protein